jgi:hypothetical protein
MLSELLVLSDGPSDEPGSVALLLPSGDEDDVWVDCGRVYPSVEHDHIGGVDIVLFPALMRELRADMTPDMLASALESAVEAALILLPSYVGRFFDDHVAVSVLTPDSARILTFDAVTGSLIHHQP